MHPSDALPMHTVNAYFCDAGEEEVIVEYCAGYPRREPIRISDLVFAETRGKAKVLLLTRSHPGCLAEFTEVRTRLIAKGIEREPGPARSSDPLWEDESLWKWHV